MAAVQKYIYPLLTFQKQHNKISKERRLLIEQELKFLFKGKNLDLGCGAYSYFPSVGFDLSEKSGKAQGQISNFDLLQE